MADRAGGATKAGLAAAGNSVARALCIAHFMTRVCAWAPHTAWRRPNAISQPRTAAGCMQTANVARQPSNASCARRQIVATGMQLVARTRGHRQLAATATANPNPREEVGDTPTLGSC